MENFTAKDISVIIKACKDSGVSSLDCGGLKLSFQSEAPVVEPEPIQGGLHLATNLVEDDSEEVQERQAEDDAELRDLELQNLMMSDPVGFEQHMRYEDETS